MVKHGQVLIRNGEAYEELQSALFSNLDLTWFTPHGLVHPEFQSFCGRKFSLGFQIENSNRLDKFESFEGSILLPVSLGENELGNVDEQIMKAQEVLQNLGMEFKSISSMDDCGIKKTGIAALSAFMTPGRPVEAEKMWLLLAMFILVDDLIDSSFADEDSLLKTLPYNKISNLNNIMAKAMRGIPVGIKDNLSAEENGPSKLKTVLNAAVNIVKRLREEALKIGTESDIKPFFQAFYAAFEATTFEGGKDWNEKDDKIFIQAQAEIARDTIYAIPLAESIALQRRVFLDDSIRNTFLFRYFRNQVAANFSKLNDVFSYRKEYLNGDGCHNEVYLLHIEKEWPLEKALGRVLNDANISMEQLINSGDLLLKMYDNDEQLADYIQIAKDAAAGHIQWLSYTCRYHPNLVFDCYVEN